MQDTSRLLIRVSCLIRTVENSVSPFKSDNLNQSNLIVESIKSHKTISKSQLCAGHKIVKQKPTKFYEYTGTYRETKFNEIDPLKDGYKDRYHDKVEFV